MEMPPSHLPSGALAMSLLVEGSRPRRGHVVGSSPATSPSPTHQPHGPALPGNRGSSPHSRTGKTQRWVGSGCPSQRLFGIPLPLPGVGYLWAEIRLHEGEVFVQLLPEDGLGEAPVGVDGVYPGHLLGHQPGRKHGHVGERRPCSGIPGSSAPQNQP